MSGISILFVLIATSQVHAQPPGHQTPDNEVCQSILEVTSSSTEPHCQPIGDCTGLSCYSSVRDQTVKVVVHKCTDPLVAEVVISAGMNENEILHSEIVKETGSNIQGSEYTIDTLMRDDLYATISVSYNSLPAVPTTVIPLNASACVCEASQYIGAHVEPPVDTAVFCQINTGCTGQECQYTSEELGGFTFFFESEFVPCKNPPGFEIIIRNSDQGALEEYYFDSNQNVTILGIFPLNIIVQHFQYSMIIQGALLYNNQWFKVIPNTQVMIDRKSCLAPTTTPISSTATPTTTRPIGEVNSETCDALKQIKNETTDVATLTSCSVTSSCTVLECSVLGEFRIHLQPLHCPDTPGIHVSISDSHNEIFNKVITDSTANVPIHMGNAKLIITVKQKENNVSIKADVDFGFEGLPIISEVDIPIDKCYCPDYSDTAECGGSDSQSSPINVAAAVSVPIVIVLLGVIVVAVTVTITMIYLTRKRHVQSPSDKMEIVKNDELSHIY